MITKRVTKSPAGAGHRSGPTLYNKWATSRISVPKTSIQTGGGSMQGWRESRMKPQGGPSQSEYRRVKR